MGECAGAKEWYKKQSKEPLTLLPPPLLAPASSPKTATLFLLRKTVFMLLTGVLLAAWLFQLESYSLIDITLPESRHNSPMETGPQDYKLPESSPLQE